MLLERPVGLTTGRQRASAEDPGLFQAVLGRRAQHVAWQGLTHLTAKSEPSGSHLTGAYHG
eukprot:1816532-Alexandrium_andersonii.AAC.1